MSMLPSRRAGRGAVFLVVAALLPALASAQAPARPATPNPAAPATAQAPPPSDVRFNEGAQRTREQLRLLLRQYPPSLAEVFRLDPSLMTNAAYMAPYPTLSAFLAEHPEISRNPSYFVGESWQNWDRNTPSARRANMIEEMFAGLALFLGALMLLGALAWAFRTLVEHRRWLRVSKIQTEAHSKLLDRLTSNEDLLAYMQTAAGRRFLESAPLDVEGAPRSFNAPIGRILWSVQAGTVAAMLGFGLLFVSSRLSGDASEFADMSPFLFMFGAVAIAIGLGFLISGAIAYLLSRRLGLFEAPPAAHA